MFAPQDGDGRMAQIIRQHRAVLAGCARQH
jgi:hypothetical protein